MKAILLIVLSVFIGFSSTAQKLRVVPSAIVDSLKSSKEYEYANDPAYWTKKQVSKGGDFWEGFFRLIGSDAFRFTVYLLLTLLFLFVIYRVLKVQGVFDRKNKKIATQEEQHELTDISVSELEERIRQYESDGQLRQAVRYHFLHLLKLLSLKQIIELRSTATNHDYLIQVSRSSLLENFALLTDIYDHVWYGEIEPDHDQYQRIETFFRKTKLSIQS